MTEKLYYKDPYVSSAECEVESIEEKGDKFELVLKSTPFYPEGGGQPCDLGFIDDIPVEYVYEKEDTIYHVVPRKPLNSKVSCKVDFDRRLDLTQQHSGEHMLSAAFFKLYKGVNAGFHLGEDYVTIDINMSDITEEMIKKAEMEANSYIYRNEPVKTYFLTKEEALKLPLRKAIKAEGTIRIVQMGENIDFSACCGTQVKRTGEVELIKIIKFEKYKGMTRIYLKCGLRALKDYIEKHDILTKIARNFSIETGEVLNKIQSQNDEISNLKREINNLYGMLAEEESKKLVSAANSKVIVKQYEDKDFAFIEKLYESLKDKEYILILSSIKDNKFIFAHNGAFDIECGKVFKEKLKEYSGKGGGNKTRAQAAFENKDKMNDFIGYLIKEFER